MQLIVRVSEICRVRLQEDELRQIQRPPLGGMNHRIKDGFQSANCPTSLTIKKKLTQTTVEARQADKQTIVTSTETNYCK